MQRFDAAGREDQKPQSWSKADNPEPRVLELAASRTAEPQAIALVWRELASPRDARAIASLWQLGKAPERVDLGATLKSETRGHVAVAASSNGPIVLTRGLTEPCDEGRCSLFDFNRLNDPHSERRGSPLSVPSACNAYSASLIASQQEPEDGPERWHYGLCSQPRNKVTTLFTIQPIPQYARAVRVLQGCSPIGWFIDDTADGRRAMLVGQCREGRKIATIPERDVFPRELSLGEPKLRCPNNQLRIVGQNGFSKRLNRPVDHIEALLPRLVAPSLSRAVWTGRVLLVASVHGDTLRLKRYACREQLLLPVIDRAPGVDRKRTMHPK